MPYWRLFYHAIWATRGREPLLDEEQARIVERSIRATGHDMRVLIHAVGTMPDHVHVAISVPPNVLLSTVIGRFKGASSHLLNQASTPSESPFAWQPEFGVLSFGERNLPEVIAYLTNQPARHAAHHLWAKMENADDPDPPRPPRPPPSAGL